MVPSVNYLPENRLETMLDRLAEMRRWHLVVGLAVFVALVAIADFVTGDSVQLTILYLPAIYIVCWTVNLKVAVFLSTFCSLLWLLDDLLMEGRRDLQHYEYWMTFVHCAFFLVIASVGARLRTLLEHERSLARTDGLTGVANSQFFVERAEGELARSRETRRPLTVAFLDCDNFKQVNDTLGHTVGDDLLRRAAEIMESSLRPTDLVARLGGDEFAILLTDTTQAEAEKVIARVRSRLQQVMEENNWPVTLSIGVVTYSTPPESLREAMREADNAMYHVKQLSKNSVEYRCVG